MVFLTIMIIIIISFNGRDDSDESQVEIVWHFIGNIANYLISAFDCFKIAEYFVYSVWLSIHKAPKNCYY